MKFSMGRLCMAGAIVVGLVASGEAGAEPGRSGWYIGGGIGANWTSDLNQVGWNLDNTCYPNSCNEPGPRHDIPGYRWNYGLDVDWGSAFEISVGRTFNRWRLEISAAQRNNEMKQNFRGIALLDGRPDTPENPALDDSVQSNSMAGIDDLTTRTLSLNAYVDFPGVFERLTPYLGVGLGVAFVEIEGLYFSSDYQDASDPTRDLSEYNGLQDEDVSDTVLLGNFHAGADYSLTDETLLGVKLTYSLMDDVEYKGSYQAHYIDGLTNLTTFSGLSQFSAMFTVKYLFGD